MTKVWLQVAPRTFVALIRLASIFFTPKLTVVSMGKKAPMNTTIMAPLASDCSRMMSTGAHATGAIGLRTFSAGLNSLSRTGTDPRRRPIGNARTSAIRNPFRRVPKLDLM